MKQLIKKLKSNQKNKTSEEKSTKENDNNYFITARSWADDIYTSAVISRNRYKIAFFSAMGLSMLLAFAIATMVPLQHTSLVVVHKSSDGVVWVDPATQPAPPPTKALTESEIVRYVVNRESYSPDAYNTQFSLIQLMSADNVEEQYMAEQSIHNKLSPISVLGNHGIKTVNVEDVLFLDNVNKNDPKNHITYHKNLAQVNFTVTTMDKNHSTIKTIPYSSLISWAYHGTPQEPSARWKHWDGFTVNEYSVQQRNVAK